MSFTNPANHIDRVSISGEEAEYIKMFDPRPVGASPPTPELRAATNPVPEVMGAALGFGPPSVPRTMTLQLMNNISQPAWDGQTDLDFFVFRERDFDDVRRFPAVTIRVPRGVVFHAESQGNGPTPHTIHWHGIEPTPMNDGVGHTSMEIGSYLYQWQPNFMGHYFYHCHRNTMQHFEFGLYGNLMVDPPDAYFASVNGADWRTGILPANITLNSIPVGACSDGEYRVACNLENLPATTQAKFRGYVSGHKTLGVATADDTGVGDPHAFTVAYDIEAQWVLDDRDSRWSNLANGAFDTFPEYDTTALRDLPDINGDEALLTPAQISDINDTVNFRANDNGFFAFNDFLADYWFITGVPVPAPPGGDASIPPNLNILPQINGGKLNSQISIQANVGQTVLVRCLDAAYNAALVTFPMDVVIIAWDGRALGVPPFGLYNEAFIVKAGTPIYLTTARRFDALIKAEQAMNTEAVITFHKNRGGARTVTARIPIVIT